MRELIYQALINDAALNELELNESNIFPNFSMKQAPRQTRFLIIRFEEQAIKNRKLGRGPEVVTIWCHQPEEMGTDFSKIRDILLVVKAAVLACRDEQGYGHYITDVKFNGMGGDHRDPGYNSFTKNIGFEILSHPVG